MKKYIASIALALCAFLPAIKADPFGGNTSETVVLYDDSQQAVASFYSYAYDASLFPITEDLTAVMITFYTPEGFVGVIYLYQPSTGTWTLGPDVAGYATGSTALADVYAHLGL